jgi:hypothetical protein
MHHRDIGWGGMDGLIWLRMGTSGGFLWTLELAFRFHKTENSWVAEWLVASQEVLSSMELVVIHRTLHKHNWAMNTLYKN